MRNQDNSTSLIKIEGTASKADTEFYLGKRIAYIYKAKTLKKGTYYRCIWGKVRAADQSSHCSALQYTVQHPPAYLPCHKAFCVCRPC
jgi:large subunit ribosomal protein L35Ae